MTKYNFCVTVMWGNLTKINVASYLLFFFRVHLFWRKKIITYHWESFSIKKVMPVCQFPKKKKDMNENFFFLSTSHKHNVSSKWAKFHIHSFMNTIIYCVTCVIANPIYLLSSKVLWNILFLILLEQKGTFEYILRNAHSFRARQKSNRTWKKK